MDEQNDYEDNPSSDEDELDEKELTKSMKSLAKKDPDFYQYLMKNEKSLLDFEEDSDDSDDEDDQDDDDEDGEPVKQKRFKVTDEFLSKLGDEIKSKPNRGNIQKLVDIFDEALVQAAGSESETESRYKISPDLFNEICEICYLNLTPGLYQILGLKLPHETTLSDKIPDPSKAKNWRFIRITLRKYLLLLVKALDVITDETAVCGLLRHSLNVAPFIRSFPSVIKKFLKVIITYWSESTEKIRVLCFLSIVRLIRSQSSDIVNVVMKKLYMSYVKHTKVTTAETNNLIRFMQQSLIELYSLDQQIAYNHAFLYIKQCAVLLRSAIIGGKKGNIKSVYNWPFVHSLILWQKVVASLNSNELMKTLINPVVQVSIGTIKLAPVAQYFPLRFHLAASLTEFSSNTKTFIPILPLLTNTLDQLDYSKKVQNDKAIDMSCILKVPKGNLHGSEFRNSVVKQVHKLVLEYLASQSHAIGFPELSFLPASRMKKFIKEKCKNPEHSKLLKQACEKIDENSKFIEERRSKCNFKFTDIDAVATWEEEIKNEKTPISSFVSKWKNIKEKQGKEKLLKEQEVKAEERKGKKNHLTNGNDKKDGKFGKRKGKRNDFTSQSKSKKVRQS